MQLTIFNGSPRGKFSNTEILINSFLQGFLESKVHDANVFYLNDINVFERSIGLYEESQFVIIAFPLFTDAFPAIVKLFIEKIPYHSNKNLGYIVQSGLPDSSHTEVIEQYLKIFTLKWCGNYLGTIRKGGLTKIKELPPKLQEQILYYLYLIGKKFSEKERFQSYLLTQFLNFTVL